jgi:hypothetical protein
MNDIQSLFLIVSSALEVDNTPRMMVVEVNLMLVIKIAKT